MLFSIGWVKNFDEIALSCTVKEIEANFCFSIFVFFPFLTKIRKFKMDAICGKRKISQIPCGSKNFDEISLPRTVREIEENLFFFPIFDKNSKWPPYVGTGKRKFF